MFGLTDDPAFAVDTAMQVSSNSMIGSTADAAFAVDDTLQVKPHNPNGSDRWACPVLLINMYKWRMVGARDITSLLQVVILATSRGLKGRSTAETVHNGNL